MNIELCLTGLFQATNIPLLFKALRRYKIVCNLVHDIFPENIDSFRYIIRFHQFISLSVYHLTLIICDIIVLKQLLADIKRSNQINIRSTLHLQLLRGSCWPRQAAEAAKGTEGQGADTARA